PRLLRTARERRGEKPKSDAECEDPAHHGVLPEGRSRAVPDPTASRARAPDGPRVKVVRWSYRDTLGSAAGPWWSDGIRSPCRTSHCAVANGRGVPIRYERSLHRQTMRASQKTRVWSRSLVQTSRRLVDTARALYKVAPIARPAGRPVPVVPRRFSIAGVVNAWDPVRRVVRIGEHTLTVAPDVSVLRLASDAHVLAAGYQADFPFPHVVTRLTVR